MFFSETKTLCHHLSSIFGTKICISCQMHPHNQIIFGNSRPINGNFQIICSSRRRVINSSQCLSVSATKSLQEILALWRSLRRACHSFLLAPLLHLQSATICAVFLDHRSIVHHFLSFHFARHNLFGDAKVGISY